VTARSDALPVAMDTGRICDIPGGSISGDTWPDNGGGTYRWNVETSGAVLGRLIGRSWSGNTGKPRPSASNEGSPRR
jgi:hypothetical protein